MEEKKYEITTETNGNLHRIKLLKNGTLGGYIEHEDNVSQRGSCFVYDNAVVKENARIEDNVEVRNSAVINGDSRIYDFVRISKNAEVHRASQIHGITKISGSASIVNAYISGELQFGCSIFDNAEIYNARIIAESGDIVIKGNARINGNNILIINNSAKHDPLTISGNVYIGNDAYITSSSDFICLGPIADKGYITFYKTKDKGIYVRSEYFNDSIKAFIKQIKNDYDKAFYYARAKNIKYLRTYLDAIKFAKKVLK